MSEYVPRFERGLDWKHDCVWVDLRPVRDTVIERAEQFWAVAQERNETRRLKGQQSWHDDTAKTRNQDAIFTGVAGEAATALLLGGKMIGHRGPGGDVVLRSGRRLEVKTCHRGWPFERWNPRANIRRAYPPAIDIVLTACDSPPFCFDRVAVVGWVPGDRWLEIAEDTQWGWRLTYSSESWERIEEIMNDELHKPYLHIGAPERRYEGDPGMPQFAVTP